MQCGISQNLAIPCGFNSLRHLNQGKIATEAESKSLYAGVDYNLTLCPLQSRLQHIYHGQPYARVDFIPQSGTLDLASELQFGPKVSFFEKACGLHSTLCIRSRN
jgi:hypothetical protein